MFEATPFWWFQRETKRKPRGAPCHLWGSLTDGDSASIRISDSARSHSAPIAASAEQPTAARDAAEIGEGGLSRHGLL